MKRWLQYGGFAAGVVLVIFGVVAIAMGANGRSAAGLKNVSLPTCTVAGKAVDSGSTARCFASYMRIHALEATGGLTYSQMPRYATADGKGTNDAAKATKGDNGQPLDNALRGVWINETALSTALNVSYMAAQLALVGVVVGVALLLSGIGFIVLAAFGMVRRETQAEDAAARVPASSPATT